MSLQVQKHTGLELVGEILRSPAELVQQEISLKITNVFSKPLVRKVFKENPAIGFTFVTAMVKRFTDSFGFSTKLTENQIEMIAIDALEYFSYESIEDMIIFFKMARSGKFGTTNRGIDSNLIFGEWFPKYMDLKSAERERLIIKKQGDLKRTAKDLEKVKNTYLLIEEKKKQKEKKRKYEEVELYVDRITKTMDRQMLEDTILDWQKDSIKKPYLDLLKKKRKHIKK